MYTYNEDYKKKLGEKMKLNLESIKEIIRFGFVGVVCTAIHYVIYLVLSYKISDNIAYTLGYGLSFLVNYVLSNYYTFKTKPSKSKGVKFVLAHGFNYLLQMLMLNIYLYIGVPKVIVPLLVYVVCIPINFLCVRKSLKI